MIIKSGLDNGWLSGLELISCLSTFLLILYLGLLQGGGQMWLGGSDAANEGTWVWTDGSPGSFFINLSYHWNIN